MTIFDLDDFAINNLGLPLLDTLAASKPDVRVTLFTVPFPLDLWMSEDAVVSGLAAFLLERPWAELALHGFHHTMLECAGWDKATALRALDWAEETGIFVRGFKGPYWAMSIGTYEALQERGWWVADHPKNNDMRPAALRCHVLGQPGIVHGHVQDIGSNGLQENLSEYMSMKPPYRFISEVMRDGR